MPKVLLSLLIVLLSGSSLRAQERQVAVPWTVLNRMRLTFQQALEQRRKMVPQSHCPEKQRLRQERQLVRLRNAIVYLKGVLQARPADPVLMPTSKWRQLQALELDIKIPMGLKPSAARPPIYHPYPGGSPFPPGKEPTLTHEVLVYWTTLHQMQTEVEVTAPGQRPSQVECWAFGQKAATLHCSIHPACRHHFWFMATSPDKRHRPQGKVLVMAGQGTLKIAVFGFQSHDFTAAPCVQVRYYCRGQLVGQTMVTAQPVPCRFSQHK